MLELPRLQVGSPIPFRCDFDVHRGRQKDLILSSPESFAGLPAILEPTTNALVSTLADFLTRKLPHRRAARLAGLLLFTGVDANTAAWREDLARRLASEQQSDGGWVDCEDTAWCSHVLGALGGDPENRRRGVAWVAAERSGDGWGYCRRDVPCIPITAQVHLLLPELRDHRSETWLREVWARDLSGPVRLSYKAAWYLLARGGAAEDTDLAKETVEYLIADQRADGGWGPWRDHPAASDCLSTGIAMWALVQQPHDAVTTEALVRAARWCEVHRLANGLFPTHYIEEGSAWVHLGWAAALRSLEPSTGQG